MLPRFRSVVRRWPRALVALGLAVVGAQGVAGTLSWCLNDAAPQVVSAVGPCHADPGAAGPGDADPAGGVDPRAPLPHVAAATDAGPAQAPAGPAAVGPSHVLFRIQADAGLRAGHGSPCAARGYSRVLRDTGPPVDPSSPGHSVRLLI